MAEEAQMKILCVGDCHVTDGQDLSRFELASKLIMDQKPDVVVLMGDFLTLNCLSAWDKDKRKLMEGRRFKAEIDAGSKALDLLTGNVTRAAQRAKKAKKKPYQPHWIYLEGNHEERLTRYFDRDPTFEGFVDIPSALNLEKRGFEFVEYREYGWLNDIGFTHIPFGKGREISGVDITRKAQQVVVKSCVFGHTHEWHVSNLHRMGQDHLQQVLNVGCFFEDHEPYVKGRMTNYWKGLQLLHSYTPGRFDVTTYSLCRLRREYGT